MLWMIGHYTAADGDEREHRMKISVGYHPLIPARSLARSLPHARVGACVFKVADLRSEVDWIGDVLGP